ncbi:SRPBCC domain-containing protein [Loktanella agnita]|uniref:SRPBCC domain-containing protein n=1 Tax=Loktanella agnita TaxID=287097 RepID=UPI003986F7E7
MKPIEKSVTVPLDPADAFALFTRDIATWWPGDSPAGREKRPKNIRFDDHKDGTISEIMADGSQQIWGRILAYDPGSYLAFTWFPGRSEDDATIVTVTFTGTPEGTRCVLNCGGYEILGHVTDAISTSYLKSWDLTLGCYASAGRQPISA